MRKLIFAISILVLFISAVVSESDVRESKPTFVQIESSIDMRRADGDSTLFTLNASGDADTTMYYYTFPDNFITFDIVNAVQDSFTYSLEIFNGHYNRITDKYIMVPVDTLVVTSHLQKDNPPQRVSIPGGELFYGILHGDTACGFNQQFRLRYRRHR